MIMISTNNKVKISLTVVVLVALLTFTFAWFVYEERITNAIEVGKVEQGIEVYFEENESTLLSFSQIKNDTTGDYYDSERGLVIINAGDPTAINYIGHLRVKIHFKPEIISAYRLLIKDEWILTRTYKSSGVVLEQAIMHDKTDSYSSFNIINSENYVVDPSSEMIYSTIQAPISDESYEINFIDGGTEYGVRDNDIYSEVCLIYMDIKLDIVQANRYKEVWQISGLEDFVSIY